MKQNLTVLDKRNRLQVNIIWGLLALGILTDFAIGLELKVILLLAGVGAVTGGIAAAMAYLRIGSRFVKYVVPCNLTIIVSLLILSDPNPIVSTYFLVYVNLAIVSLYSDYKPIILTGVLGAGLSTYLFLDPFYQEKLFPGESLALLFLYLAFATTAMAIAAGFSAKLQKEVTERQSEALKAQQLSERILGQLKDSIGILTTFSREQQQHVHSTGTISREVTGTFSEMTAAIEKQTGSVVSINESAQEMEEFMGKLREGASSLQQYAEQNVSMTEQNSAELEKLASEMAALGAIMSNTVAGMEVLQRHNEQVTAIVDTISDISEQTNLLALNAAIEAARAGEHGRGFAVVSGEVRKLADHSRKSTEEIGSILTEIRAQIDEAYAGVTKGQEAVRQSGEVTRKSVELFQDINGNAHQTKEHSRQLGEGSTRLYQRYGELAAELDSIAATTQQNMASVEEVQASMESQNQKIAVMVEEYAKLDSLVSELKNLSEQKTGA
ncbi:chemotaxis protein [Paenibacillus oryzae]|uniref:Chemotaxis protein n=1 Tax=Paenibacillus oryzae TaxID=1844972 RepID=A0A1A5YFV4_9BACL|nr:methyl-accepting chemotaxis protein [Paenibacillus oryzae]OBR64280.1 chemotaxis protein [Paenibacillus oryzae]